MHDAIVELELDTNDPKRSGLATAALISSLIICCPLTTVIGPILGIISLCSLKGKPHVAGRGFAWSAIIVGIIATIIWVAAGTFFGGLAMQFIEKTGAVTTESIQAGYDKDYTKFREGLARSSIHVTDEEIASFIGELQSRYGKFDSASMNLEEQQQTLKPSGNETPIPIRFIFETMDVTGDILMEINSSNGIEFTLKIGCIRITDPKNGDIAFPKDSPCDFSSPKDDGS